MKNLLIIIILTFGYIGLFAQVEDENIKDVLQEKGITEEQFQEELKKRGMTEEQAIQEAKNQGIDKNTFQNEEKNPLEPLKKLEEEKVEAESEKAKAEAEKIKAEAEVIKAEANEGEEDELPIRKLPKEEIYGQDIFRNKTLKLFEPIGDFRAPDDYIIGEGDEFSITIWGRAEYSNILAVNKEGYIKDQYLPRVYVKGMTYRSAVDAVKSNISKVYNMKDSYLEIVLSYSRQITVGIYGNIFDPGSYSVSALNTAMNALVAAGGPNQTGSVRSIKIMRSGGTDKILDVYKYMENPGIADNLYLQDNDVIYVPAAGKVVRIQGAIKRPMNYELIGSEGVLELVKHAGGLRPNAYKNNIQIERYTNDRQVLVDIDLNDLLSKNKKFLLLDGDVVNIPMVKESYDNYVVADGAVEQAGKFELVSGMRLKDLILKSGLAEDARVDKVYVLRKQEDLTNRYIRLNLKDVLENRNSSDNILLRPRDKIQIFSKSQFVDEFTVSISGEVRKPGGLDYDNNVRISDLLYFAGGIKPSASEIALVKSIELDNSTSYQRINLGNVMNDIDSDDNILMEPKDELIVYPKSKFSDDFSVEIFGAVREPGLYPYNPNMTLNDVIFISGGLRAQAANSRVEVSRVIKDNVEQTTVVVATLNVDKDLVLSSKSGFKLEPYDQIFIRNAPGFELQRNIVLKGEVQYPGVYSLTDKNERILSVIERAGGLTESAFKQGATLRRVEDETGFVLLDLEEVVNDPNSKFNYVLKEQDVITVPKIKDLVTLAGAIKFPGIDSLKKLNVPYHKNKNAKFYINKYGAGVDRKEKKGRKRLVFVEYPNGYTKRVKRYVGVKVYPKVEKGSKITVHRKKQKPEKRQQEKKETDWAKVVSTSIAQVTAVLTLIILIDRAFAK